MSRPRPDLPNSVQAARQYVGWLGRIPQVEKVLLQGSRSPLREKSPTEASDWDLVVISSVSNLRLVRPRDAGQLHADLVITTPEKATFLRKWVELYPTDTHGVFDASSD